MTNPERAYPHLGEDGGMRPNLVQLKLKLNLSFLF